MPPWVDWKLPLGVAREEGPLAAVCPEQASRVWTQEATHSVCRSLLTERPACSATQSLL